MATTITPVKCARDAATQFTFTSVSASGEFEIAWGVRDESAAIVVLGGAADTTVEIYAGEGVQGNKSLTVTCPDAEYTVIPIKSGRFKNDYGTNVGKVLGKVGSGGGCSIAVVEYDA